MPVGVAARSVASAVVVALFTVACGSPLPSTRDEPAYRTVLRDGVWELHVRVDRAHVIVAQIADSPFSAPTVRLEFAGAP
jgi:hypothetical protein